MKILVLMASPRCGGNTDLLCDSFIDGAKESGNVVEKINLGTLNIRGCKNCLQCFQNGVPCVQQDDMNSVYPSFMEADMVVFASPIYFWGINGQLKSALDRTFALDYPPGMKYPVKEFSLLLTAGSNDPAVTQYAAPYFDYAMGEKLGWKNRGTIFAGGMEKIGDVLVNGAYTQAYEMGKSIG